MCKKKAAALTTFTRQCGSPSFIMQKTEPFVPIIFINTLRDFPFVSKNYSVPEGLFLLFPCGGGHPADSWPQRLENLVTNAEISDLLLNLLSAFHYSSIPK